MSHRGLPCADHRDRCPLRLHRWRRPQPLMSLETMTHQVTHLLQRLQIRRRGARHATWRAHELGCLHCQTLSQGNKSTHPPAGSRANGQRPSAASSSSSPSTTSATLRRWICCLAGSEVTQGYPVEGSAGRRRNQGRRRPESSDPGPWIPFPPPPKWMPMLDPAWPDDPCEKSYSEPFMWAAGASLYDWEKKS